MTALPGTAPLALQAVQAALDATGDEHAAAGFDLAGQLTVTLASAGTYGLFAAALATEAIADWMGTCYSDGDPEPARTQVMTLFAKTSSEWRPQADGDPPLLLVTFHDQPVTPGPGPGGGHRRCPADGAPLADVLYKQVHHLRCGTCRMVYDMISGRRGAPRGRIRINQLAFTGPQEDPRG